MEILKSIPILGCSPRLQGNQLSTGSPLQELDLMIYSRGLKLNLPGGCWRQSLAEAGPHQIFCQAEQQPKEAAQEFP